MPIKHAIPLFALKLFYYLLIGHLVVGDGMCSNILHMAETIKFLGRTPLMTSAIYFFNNKGWFVLLLFFLIPKFHVFSALLDICLVHSMVNFIKLLNFVLLYIFSPTNSTNIFKTLFPSGCRNFEMAPEDMVASKKCEPQDAGTH